MKTADAIKKAGGLGELAGIFGISKSAISQWPENVPTPRLYELQVKRPAWFANGSQVAEPEKAS